jgi:hypothetical protein
MSEIDIRDPTNDLTGDEENLFAQQNLTVKLEPDSLQQASTPIRGWDPDVSSISVVASPYGGDRTIASAQSLQDALSEFEENE